MTYPQPRVDICVSPDDCPYAPFTGVVVGVAASVGLSVVGAALVTLLRMLVAS